MTSRSQREGYRYFFVCGLVRADREGNVNAMVPMLYIIQKSMQNSIRPSRTHVEAVVVE